MIKPSKLPMLVLLNMESAMEVVLFSRGWYNECRSTISIEHSQHINMHYANCHFEPLGHMIDGGGCCSDMHPLLNDIGCSLCQFIFWFSKPLVSPIMQQFMAGIGVTLMILSFDVSLWVRWHGSCLIGMSWLYHLPSWF